MAYEHPGAEEQVAGPSNGRFLHSGSPAAEWVTYYERSGVEEPVADAALKASHGSGGNVGALECWLWLLLPAGCGTRIPPRARLLG